MKKQERILKALEERLRGLPVSFMKGDPVTVIAEVRHYPHKADGQSESLLGWQGVVIGYMHNTSVISVRFRRKRPWLHNGGQYNAINAQNCYFFIPRDLRLDLERIKDDKKTTG